MPGTAELSLSTHAVASILRENGTILLDTADRREKGRVLLFERPIEEICSRSLESVDPSLTEVDRCVADGHWVAGFISYEAGYAFEPRFRGAHIMSPLLWFGVYSAPTELEIASLDESMTLLCGGSFRVQNPRLSLAQADHEHDVEDIRLQIRDGDVYQINYTFPLLFDFDGDSRAFYACLRAAQPVPYAAFVRAENLEILSLSPELFFMRDGNRITTRPMKGTAPAVGRPQADAHASDRLRNDPKNRAENLMIVDLLRNDLSRCCLPGSVEVPDLFTVHQYPSVLQMTSSVTGELKRAVSYRDIFRALFPCGSVTGAPKIRAMEIIRDRERSARGIYCGAIGFISPDQKATFSVAIRTIVLEGSTGRMGTGSGIVWDSKPVEEYEECLLKTRFVADASGPVR